jgi:hypothetical protein
MKKRLINFLIIFAVLLVDLGLAGFCFAYSVELKNPLKFDTVPELITAIIDGIGKFIGALATIMFIVAGILYLTSAGNQTKMDNAKKALGAAIVGLVIYIAVVPIRSTICDVLGATWCV